MKTGRPRLPIAKRVEKDPKTITVATNLSYAETGELDAVADAMGELRSEFIRRAIDERIAKHWRRS